MAEQSGDGNTPLTRRLLTEPARPERIRNASFAPWLAVGTVCIGAFMGQLDASIVTVALPSLRAELHASLGAVEWVSLSYLLVLVGSLIAVGRIADVFGRKLLYTYGFALFSLASLGCGLSRGLAVLIVMRVVQAIGAALLQANSVALIRTTVSREQLNRAIGLQGAAQAIGLALGPAVGGLLIAAGGWRWVFWVNLPAGALGIVLGVLLLPRTRIRSPRNGFDWVGLATLVPATGLVLLGLSELQQHLEVATVLIAAGLLGLGGFVRIERRAAAPLLDPGLFRSATLRAGLGSGLLGYLVLFAILLVTPLFLTEQQHRSAAAAGLLITVLPAALALTSPVAGRLSDRFGHRPVTVAGLLVTAAGLISGAGGAVLVLLLLAGIGLGLFIPANNAAVAGSGRQEQAGLVSGVLNTTRGVGTALGVAVAGALFGLHGLGPTVLVLAALALVGAAVSGTAR